MSKGSGVEPDCEDVPLDVFVKALRPRGVGMPLSLPPSVQDKIRSVIVFSDGSIGVLWKGEKVLTFSTANAGGDMQEVSGEESLVGCRVLYVKVGA